jgi:hypothetical protein
LGRILVVSQLAVCLLLLVYCAVELLRGAAKPVENHAGLNAYKDVENVRSRPPGMQREDFVTRLVDPVGYGFQNSALLQSDAPIFTAMPEQLGLRLVPQTAPVPVSCYRPRRNADGELNMERPQQGTAAAVTVN